MTDYERYRNELTYRMKKLTYVEPLREERQKIIEKIKLWDAVHGLACWDKDHLQN